MRTSALILASMALPTAGCVHMVHENPVTAGRSILNVLTDQQAAWNRGDIPAFMEGYWKSDALRFASGGTVATGWQVTKDRYLKRYDSPEKMGTLSFTQLAVTPMGEVDALVTGRWKLKRETDTPNGLFTLHFRKIDGNWVIVSDHTSSAD